MTYVLNGHDPVLENDLSRWAEWMKDQTRRVVERTYFDGDSCLVSTVFLGTNHRWLGDGPPILFETMIFGVPSAGDYLDRYCTWNEAVAGHRRAIQYLRDLLDASESGEDKRLRWELRKATGV